jgi:hypothetical protein
VTVSLNALRRRARRGWIGEQRISAVAGDLRKRSAARWQQRLTRHETGASDYRRQKFGMMR